MSKTLGQLAELVGGAVVGDAAVAIEGVATLESAGPGQIAFLANPKYARQLADTKAAAVIVSPQVADGPTNLLQSADPYFAFRQVMVEIYGFRRHPPAGVDPHAAVDASAELGEGVAVCAFATVSAGARVGPRTVLYPGVFVGPEARIGADCVLYPNVAVYDRCVLGERVILHAGTAVGTDGFGYATHAGAHHKIPQMGIVRIGDDVELGANCAVERAALGETVIETGTKFADMVDIGHGTRVGRHCLFVSQVGVSGSVQVGDYVVLGGQVGVTGHLRIGSKVTVAAKGAVINDVPEGATVLGQPAIDITKARKNYVAFTQLAEMRERLKALEAKVRELGGA